MIDALPGDIFRQGQILNNTYEIEGVLGRGGTGEVYRARNQISGRIVAIKALNARFSGNDDYIALMRREEQMRDILDDAVVRYTECSRTDQGHVFLVMDFIAGPSMADVMVHRRMEPRELMIIGHRVAEGLVAAHRHGIVHRDLSPDNIILRGDNPERATIIDFGIAKDTAAGARTIVGNDFAGKYEYAAPEQLEGRAEPRSDLYALGALLLAAFRGQVPFAGATPGEMIRRKQSPLDTTGVPDPLKSLINWLAAPDLAERAPSAAAVVAQLSQNLKPASARGRPP
ncbi:MAG TPA: serine/threonine-protein kinase, partial [Paracoccaceae bacterium]